MPPTNAVMRACSGPYVAFVAPPPKTESVGLQSALSGHVVYSSPFSILELGRGEGKAQASGGIC